jgi:hypothetical protein
MLHTLAQVGQHRLHPDWGIGLKDFNMDFGRRHCENVCYGPGLGQLRPQHQHRGPLTLVHSILWIYDSVSKGFGEHFNLVQSGSNRPDGRLLRGIFDRASEVRSAEKVFYTIE